MPEQQIPAAELRDGDVVVDKAGTRWPVSGVEMILPDDPWAQSSRAFWIGNPPLHRLTKAGNELVTVERPDAPPEWAVAKESHDVFGVKPDEDAALSYGAGAEPERPVETMEPVALVEEKLGGEVLAEESKAHEHARNAATVTGQPMTLPHFEQFTILEKRSHLFLVHGIYAHDIKEDGKLSNLHVEAHNAAEKPGRWVAHEHVAGAPFPTEIPQAES